MATTAVTTKLPRTVGKKRVWDMDLNDVTRLPFDFEKWAAAEGAGVQIASVEWILGPNVTLVQGGYDTLHATANVKFTDPAAVMDGMTFVTCRMTTNESTPQVRDRTYYLNPVTD